MFGSKKNDKPFSSSKEGMQGRNLNLIGKGTTINGEVLSEGDIRIDGIVNGNVKAKAKVVVGPSGIIEGDIYSDSVDVFGKVKGRIETQGILYLKETAYVEGDFASSKLS